MDREHFNSIVKNDSTKTSLFSLSSEENYFPLSIPDFNMGVGGLLLLQNNLQLIQSFTIRYKTFPSTPYPTNTFTSILSKFDVSKDLCQHWAKIIELSFIISLQLKLLECASLYLQISLLIPSGPCSIQLFFKIKFR